MEERESVIVEVFHDDSGLNSESEILGKRNPLLFQELFDLRLDVLVASLIFVFLFDYSQGDRLQDLVYFHLDLKAFFEVSTEIEELFEQDGISFVRVLHVKVGFQSPEERLSHNLWVAQCPVYQHFSEGRKMLVFIEQSLGQLKHIQD